MSILQKLAYESGLYAQGTPDSWDIEHLEMYGKAIISDILIVVAAHALSGDSAVEVYKNLKRIYEC